MEPIENRHCWKNNYEAYLCDNCKEILTKYQAQGKKFQIAENNLVLEFNQLIES